jgi:hypothetical protein
VALLVSLDVRAGDDVLELELTRRLSSILGVPTLVPAPTDDSYLLTLVDAAEGPRVVSLDPGSLDKRGEYRLSDERH